MVGIFRYIFFSFFLIIIIYWGSSFSFGKQHIKLPPNSKPNAFVILELFTSQSCSSCPPANTHLLNLINEIKEKKLPVFPIAFHVDYWNHLGWKDSFSNQKFTERQYSYARSLSKLQVYTPQIIINGTTELAGSDIEECERLIISELGTEPSEIIPLKAVFKQYGDSINIEYEVDDTFRGFVNVALIQKEGIISIKAGENAGKDLKYVNIVRQFAQLYCSNSPQNRITLTKPDDLSIDNLKVIVYLQNKVNMQILNGTEATLL